MKTSLSPYASAMRVQRADALFLSGLQPSDTTITPASAAATVRAVLAKCGGLSACVCLVAAEYGEHPDAAAARMQWALGVADTMPLSEPFPRRVLTAP